VTFTEADQGEREFGVILRTAGKQAIRIVDVGDHALHGSVQLEVVPNNAEHFEVFVSDVAVEGKEVDVVVSAIDAFGNVITDYTGTVHFNSSDANSILPADYTFTLDDQGIHTFTIVFGTPGTQVIRVTDIATTDVMFGNTEVEVKTGRSADGRSIARAISSAPSKPTATLPAMVTQVNLSEVTDTENAGTPTSSRALAAVEAVDLVFQPELMGRMILELTLHTPGEQTFSVSSAENPEVSTTVNIVVEAASQPAAVASMATAVTAKSMNRPNFEDSRNGPQGQEGIRPNRRTVKKVLSTRDDVWTAITLAAHMD
jgi:hypothetical protein